MQQYIKMQDNAAVLNAQGSAAVPHMQEMQQQFKTQGNAAPHAAVNKTHTKTQRYRT
jgi:hypothetical protein